MRGHAGSQGLVLFRLPSGRPLEVSARVAAVAASRSDWAGHFSVVEQDRVRMRALPA